MLLCTIPCLSFSGGFASRAVARRSPVLAMSSEAMPSAEVQQQIEQLSARIEMLKLQAQIRELESKALQAPAEMAPSAVTKVIETAPEAPAVVAKLVEAEAPVVAAQVVQTEAPTTMVAKVIEAMPQPASVVIDQAPLQEAAATAAAFDVASLLPYAAGLALLPVGVLGAKAFVSFVDERYEQLNGDAGAGVAADAPATVPMTLSSPAVSAPPAIVGRSATDIFFTDVLKKKPGSEGEAKEGDAKSMMQKVKDAGVAGAISYAAWELGFWGLSAPVALFAYYEFTGHWPDFSNADDMQKLGAEAFAFVNVARFAVPLRIGLALSTTPWVQENVVEKIDFLKAKGAEGQEGGDAAAPPKFTPPSPGNKVANKMWMERQAELEALRASDWEGATGGSAVGGRSAPDIILGGLKRLESEPTGWLFGPPSALYSNLNLASPSSQRGARSAAATAAAKAVPDYQGLPSLTPLPADTVGRVVPTKKRVKQATGSARVPPSTPEELELARKGEWSYGAPDES